MIQLENVSFSYESTPVLHDITIVENAPVLMGLWGRNGAGKTSLMKLISGLQRPNAGIITIRGQAPYNNAKAQQYLCYMQEDHPFSFIWSVRDALRFARYYNPNWNQDLAEHLLHVFRLPEKRKVKKLSKGMKTALQIIIGLASQADITIMDEPTNGLDADMRKKFYQVLRESHEEHPRLIMISTHHIEEIQPLLESLVVLHDGRLLLHDLMDDVRGRGIWLAGDKQKVDQLVQEQPVLEQVEAGSVKKVMIDVPLTNKWKDKAHAHGLTIEKAHLQDYLLNITQQVEVAN